MRLSTAQMDVLRWIADGCPDGVFEGYAHRVSAAALRTRGLARVTGHGPSWHAEITPTGRALIEEPPSDRDARVNDRPGPAPSRPSGRKERPPRPLPPAEALIADLLAAGGVLRVPYWRKEGEPDYHQRIRAARRWGKVPEGKRLVSDLVQGELEIRLVDAPEGTTIAARPVPVPARVARAHPVAARYRADTEHHQVSRGQLSRCVRIVHALATECERRGYELRKLEHQPRRDYSGRDHNGNGSDFTVTFRGFSYSLKLSEEKVPVRGRWEEQERLRKSDYYTRRLGIEPRIGRYDKEGTGRLTLRLDSGYGRDGRQSSWGDRRSWTLEDKLPEVLREIEIRAAEDEQRAAERKRQEEERQRRWEQAMERAKVAYAEEYRAAALRSQIAKWQEAQLVRAYVAALEEAKSGDPEAAEWIEWVRAFSSLLDPLDQPVRMPEVPEPNADDLKPFLGGWSPYGPSR